jgi:hypothetical protein
MDLRSQGCESRLNIPVYFPVRREFGREQFALDCVLRHPFVCVFIGLPYSYFPRIIGVSFVRLCFPEGPLGRAPKCGARRPRPAPAARVSTAHNVARSPRCSNGPGESRRARQVPFEQERDSERVTEAVRVQPLDLRVFREVEQTALPVTDCRREFAVTEPIALAHSRAGVQRADDKFG